MRLRKAPKKIQERIRMVVECQIYIKQAITDYSRGVSNYKNEQRRKDGNKFYKTTQTSHACYFKRDVHPFPFHIMFPTRNIRWAESIAIRSNSSHIFCIVVSNQPDWGVKVQIFMMVIYIDGVSVMQDVRYENKSPHASCMYVRSRHRYILATANWKAGIFVCMFCLIE